MPNGVHLYFNSPPRKKLKLGVMAGDDSDFLDDVRSEFGIHLSFCGSDVLDKFVLFFFSFFRFGF